MFFFACYWLSFMGWYPTNLTDNLIAVVVLTVSRWLQHERTQWESFCRPITGIKTHFSSSDEHSGSLSPFTPPSVPRGLLPSMGGYCVSAWVSGSLALSRTSFLSGLDRRHRFGVIDTQPSELCFGTAAGCLHDRSWSHCWLLGHHVTQYQRLAYVLSCLRELNVMLWLLRLCYNHAIIFAKTKDIFHHVLYVEVCSADLRFSKFRQEVSFFFFFLTDLFTADK